MNVECDELGDIELAPDFRREKLLHDRMVRVCRWGQRLAAEVTEGRDDLFHCSLRLGHAPTIADALRAGTLAGSMLGLTPPSPQTRISQRWHGVLSTIGGKSAALRACRLSLTIIIRTVIHSRRAKIMAKRHLRRVTPATVLRTVTPKRPPNSDLRTREHLTEAEVERLIKATRDNRYGYRDALMILMAYRHGLCAAEVTDLKWEQVDFDRGELHVNRLKEGTESTHPMTGRELRELRRHRRESPCIAPGLSSSPSAGHHFRRKASTAWSSVLALPPTWGSRSISFRN